MLPGLTLKERLWKLHLVSMLYASLLGDDIASPHGDFAKSTLGGFGSCTLKAFATNAAAITQALVCRTPSQKKVLPNALHILLRAWVETDDLENGFSRLKANLGGWKGDAEAMRVAGPRGEAHATIRRNADRGFSLGKDSKSKSVQSALLSRLATKDNRPCGSLNRPVVTLAPSSPALSVTSSRSSIARSSRAGGAATSCGSGRCGGKSSARRSRKRFRSSRSENSTARNIVS